MVNYCITSFSFTVIFFSLCDFLQMRRRLVPRERRMSSSLGTSLKMEEGRSLVEEEAWETSSCKVCFFL